MKASMGIDYYGSSRTLFCISSTDIEVVYIITLWFGRKRHRIRSPTISRIYTRKVQEGNDQEKAKSEKWRSNVTETNIKVRLFKLSDLRSQHLKNIDKLSAQVIGSTCVTDRSKSILLSQWWFFLFYVLVFKKFLCCWRLMYVCIFLVKLR